MVVKVHLTRRDMALVERLAQQRNANNRRHGNRDLRVAVDLESLEIDRQGATGEVAVAKYLGVQVDHWAGPGAWERKHALVHDGRAILVRYTTYKSGRLLFNSSERFTADIAVLVVKGRDESEALLAGWISRERFLEEHYTGDLGYGRRVYVYQSQLDPMDELVNGRVEQMVMF